MITKKLGDICTIASGGTPLRSKEEYWKKGNIPWIKIGDIHSKHVCKAEECITADGLEHSSAKMLPKGTILYTIFATLGEVGILDIDACTNQAIAGITIKENQPLRRDYLYYFLKSKKGYVNRVGRGVAQNNINMSILREMPVPLPEERAQEKIVSVLDKINDITERRKTELATFDELVKARFVEMFGDPVRNEKGWEVKVLSDVGSCKNGMNFHNDETGVQIHCLGVGDFKDNSFITDTESLPLIALSETPAKEYLLENDDIVFVRSNGNKNLVGRSVLVYPNDIPVTFSGFCIRYRLKDACLNPQYLLQVLKADSIRNLMHGRGANIQNLNQKILLNVMVPIPPLDLQNQFVVFTHQVEKSKAAVQRSLEETQTLFDSLMQQYFG